ncbi:ImmA/IrrE family metallo-endopeptidase [Streptococcus canis]|uniref:ImmA/IrrE family metallo-endopeptidase n=1 Tax=Streptococcus canis TaxID=1329 RepID=UPI002949709D|nr:ImmA/IrrE family metallo-endopeptidase [Streptococcus canis]MDV5987548.1 ImmA/IrrE family metallo-endopeptidase [Streptococcus canis]
MTVYNKISGIAHEIIYSFMKLHEIKSSNYSYHQFFEKKIIDLDIIVMEHNLNNDISGLSIKDKNGHQTISYQANHHINRQNFTKCHELAHFLLNHEGTIFMNNEENNVQEYEANAFAGIILAPDIILLGKIVYQKKTFQQILKDLSISRETLNIRLEQLLCHCKKRFNRNDILKTIDDFNKNKNKNLMMYLKAIESEITDKFLSTKINTVEQINYILDQKHFTTNIDIPEIENEKIVNTIKKDYPYLKNGLYYDKSTTIYYIYDERFFSDKEAKSKARTIWFIEAI